MMKNIFSFLVICFLVCKSFAQNTDCILVSYKNYKKNETGVIAFCTGNSNTLMVNNYSVDNNVLISSVLLTPAGLEVRESEPSWKSIIKPMQPIPSEKALDFLGYKVNFVTYTDGTQTAKIWFTKDIKFFNSQNYWLFYSGLGMTIQEKHGEQFPLVMQLLDASGKPLYEHTAVEKTLLSIKPELFKQQNNK